VLLWAKHEQKHGKGCRSKHAKSALSPQALLRLVHYQHEKVSGDAAHLLSFFAEDCFAPLCAQTLKIDPRHPFNLPKDLLVLMPSVAEDDKGAWSITTPSLAHSWRGILNLAEFRARFDCSTGGLFKHFDWSGICVAGDLLLGLLCGQIGGSDVPRKRCANSRETVEVSSASAWAKVNVELFIYGLETVDAIIVRLRDLYAHFTAQVGRLPLIVRSPTTISYVFGAPVPVIQIALVSHSSIASVLSTLDLDAVMLAYTGDHLYTNTRGGRFLLSTIAGTAVNLFNPSRPAPRPDRVSALAQRGVGLAVDQLLAVDAGIGNNHIVAADAKAAMTEPSKPLYGLREAYRHLRAEGRASLCDPDRALSFAGMSQDDALSIILVRAASIAAGAIRRRAIRHIGIQRRGRRRDDGLAGRSERLARHPRSCGADTFPSCLSID
jgi:hypothetical protein